MVIVINKCVIQIQILVMTVSLNAPMVRYVILRIILALNV